MFGISGEHLLVLVVILLIFGPRRLPDLGASLGRTLRNFKDAMNNDQIPAQPAAPVSQQIPAQPTASAAPAAPAATQQAPAPQQTV